MTENDIRDIEDHHVKLKKKLSDANIKYNRLKIDLKKELNNLKDAHQHELNFFNRNHKSLKVCIKKFQTEYNINCLKLLLLLLLQIKYLILMVLNSVFNSDK